MEVDIPSLNNVPYSECADEGYSGELQGILFQTWSGHDGAFRLGKSVYADLAADFSYSHLSLPMPILRAVDKLLPTSFTSHTSVRSRPRPTSTWWPTCSA